MFGFFVVQSIELHTLMQIVIKLKSRNETNLWATMRRLTLRAIKMLKIVVRMLGIINWITTPSTTESITSTLFAFGR